MIFPLDWGLRCFFRMIFGVIGPRGRGVEGILLMEYKGRECRNARNRGFGKMTHFLWWGTVGIKGSLLLCLLRS